MQVPLAQSLSTSIMFFFIALCARALFSFLETSITALRLFKLKELAATTDGYRLLFKSLEQYPHRVLITILIANSLADVTTAALATHITETIFTHFNLSGGLGFSLGIGLATIAILLFGEIIPKNLAKGKGEELFRSTLWITNILFYVLYPLVSILIRFSYNLLVRIGNKKLQDASEWVSSEREIRFLIDYIYEQGLMEAEKSKMLQNIFELGSTQVKEIMIPEIDIIAVSAHQDIKSSLNIFLEHQFSRLPVYDGSLDNVVGMVHLKDIFVYLPNQPERLIKDVMRPIMFVPESMKVNQLLRQFRQEHVHIAVILNEHGSLTGLITLEDVLEEIVGEIHDEHAQSHPKIVALKQGGWLIDGSCPLEDIAELLGIIFDTDDSHTIGGFLAENLQHLPQKGERVLYKNFYFQVQKASPKRVLQVLVFEEEKILEQTEHSE